MYEVGILTYEVAIITIFADKDTNTQEVPHLISGRAKI